MTRQQRLISVLDQRGEEAEATLARQLLNTSQEARALQVADRQRFLAELNEIDRKLSK